MYARFDLFPRSQAERGSEKLYAYLLIFNAANKKGHLNQAAFVIGGGGGN